MRKREELDEALRLLNQACGEAYDEGDEQVVMHLLGPINALCWVLKCRLPGSNPERFENMIQGLKEEKPTKKGL